MVFVHEFKSEGCFTMLNKEQIEAGINDFLLEEIAMIIAGQESKGLKASGESAKGLKKQMSSVAGDNIVRGEIVDTSHSFEYQERGRGPSIQGSPFGVISGGLWGKIYTWLRYKKYGLNWKDKKARVGLAFAITKKIQKKGTFTFIQGKKTGVLSEPLSEERLDAFKEKLMTTQNVIEIKKILIQGFNF